MNGQDSSHTLAAICTLPAQVDQKLSDTSSSPPVIIATPSVASEPDGISLHEGKMDASQESAAAAQTADKQQADDGKQVSLAQQTKQENKIDTSARKKVHAKSKHASHKTRRRGHGSHVSETSSSDSDGDSDHDSSEDDKAKQKKKKKKKRASATVQAPAQKQSKSKKQKQKTRVKDRKKSKKYESTTEDETASDSSGSESDSEVADKTRRKGVLAKGKKKKSKKIDDASSDSSEDSSSSSSSSEEMSSEDEKAKKKAARAKTKAKRKNKKAKKAEASASSSESSSSEKEDATVPSSPPEVAVTEDTLEAQLATVSSLLQSLKAKKQSAAEAAAAAAATNTSSSAKAEKASKKKTLEFKRVDQVFDLNIHDWKLVESNKDKKDNFDCVFTVRRRLNWEGKYVETRLDIKSKLLRGALQEVLRECKSISLVEDVPQLDPHTLFHYYDELKAHVDKTLKSRLHKVKRGKEQKRLKLQIAQCKLLLGYIDEDYTATRKALKPMLKAGTITYDLVWALFKPNTIAFTPTYQNKDDPRCFKVDGSYEYESWMTGIKSWYVDGKYLEYDGKTFGLGDHQVAIQAFKGHRKITSLAAYPLAFHKDPEGIRKQLIERGKKFVALEGMNYRLQKGIAYMKHKNSIVRFIINGRVMVDPAIFRRINPNYPLSYLRADELAQDEEDDGGCEDEDGDGDDDDADDNSDEGCGCASDEEEREKDKMRIVMWKDKKGRRHAIKVRQSVIDKEVGVGGDNGNSLSGDEDGERPRQVFTEEELLIASPVVLGFAFSDKLWLEFSLSGIEDIKWNDEAFSSLVLPAEVKQNLKGLVSSHRFHAAKTIDDVIQGKGKGLNVVLHGPPGVGKTLTGESIAEYLQCPLYAVSAGELGTNSRTLETDLNRIMDITHSWGAILLLDEADVFLEARQPHDIQRNSLVSVFLRLTEYYQGILFLTTNRVETFDEAFQSRIHMGIRYEHLPAKARRKIWQQHVGKVEKMRRQAEAGGDGHEMKPFTDADFDELSKRNMNGRQIKNTVKTSQAIALAEKAVFSMEHVRRVLEVAEAFEDDMKGGKGYRDAMRQYT